jgi:hypothetical protein
MTEFKTGDRVVFTKDDSWAEGGELVARMPKGTLGTYLGTRAWHKGAPWVRLDTGEHVLAWADAIAPAEDHGTGDGSASDIPAPVVDDLWDAKDRVQREVAAEVFTAPAPLDPSKVKAGDTVTLENGQTAVRGPVIGIDTAVHTNIVSGFSIEGVGWRYFIPDVLAQQDTGVWTLTDHQPAPEPEPYTPTREQIRQAYVDARGDADLITESEAGAEFDRWLDSLGLTR